MPEDGINGSVSSGSRHSSSVCRWWREARDCIFVVNLGRNALESYGFARSMGNTGRRWHDARICWVWIARRMTAVAGTTGRM